MASGDAHPRPIRGAHFRVYFPILDNDGDLVTGAAGLDSERSLDGGTFADCTNEAVEIPTNSGVYALDLTGVETTCSGLIVTIASTTTNAKTTVLTLYPVHHAIIGSATAQGGTNNTVTLNAGASSQNGYYSEAWVLLTNDTPSGAQYQARKIIDYNGSTKVATVLNNWATNPSSATTFDILCPGGWAPLLCQGTQPVDARQVNGSATAAINLGVSAGQMLTGTVDTAGFAPTVTEFESSGITEATADHFNGRVVVWTSGALQYQVAPITDYALVGGRGHFTVATMTEAPANGNAFIIV